MEKKIGIYKITSPNNRVYIGQSIDIDERISRYKRLKNCSGQHRLYNSFLKYGVINHEFEIIELCDRTELNKRERYWQEHYNVLKEGLNCMLTGVDDVPIVFSDEVRKKMSVSGSGRKQSSEQVRKRVQSKNGYKHSQETKDKIAKSSGVLVFNFNNGIYYFSIKEAAETTNVSESHLGNMLNGIRKNNSNFILA